MKIDISRVNLLEKDIEDWLYENPGAINSTYNEIFPITRWIGRQYRLPSGIADLVGVRDSGQVVVVEIKNVLINRAAILQVCRYAADLLNIVSNREGYKFNSVERILIGPGVEDGQTFTEAQACGVAVVQFEAQLQLSTGTLEWSNSQYREREKRIRAISERDEWAIFGRHYDRPYPDDEKDSYSDIILEGWGGASAEPTPPDKDEYDKLMDAIVKEDGADGEA